MDELADVAYIKRVSVGNIDPNRPPTEEELDNQIKLLNRCLNKSPKGRIIGREISAALFQVGENKLMIQNITYHVGFPRKPYWLEED
ncbi:MAG: hypothetical protein IMF02_14400 [Proteobacteria bacterium]|nr:hypothetical protein [Pseudomonadota bacterium]